MSTYKVHVTQPTEVFLDGNIVEIDVGIYNVDNIEFCKENDFFKCDRCKEWFDESISVGIYHDQYKKCKGKDYCEPCFSHKFK